MCGFSGIGVYGIPIPKEIHNQLPEATKKAWAKFDKWWRREQKKTKGRIYKKTMPPDIAECLEIIKDTPIPGLGNVTCKESCYIRGIEFQLNFK